MSVTTPTDDCTALLDRIEADAKAAEFYRWRVATVVPALRRSLERLQELRPGALGGDDPTAQLARRIEAIVTLGEEESSGDDPWLTLKQGAEYAGCLKGDSGVPRDSYYAAVRNGLGPRKHIRRSEIDELRGKGIL